MPMTFQTYRTIKRTLAQTLHARHGSHQEKHLNTLAVLICGIVRTACPVRPDCRPRADTRL